MKKVIGLNFFLGALIMLLSVTCSPKYASAQVGRGSEWLSWSGQERSNYLAGFIDGYLRGSHRACITANELFEVGEPHRLGEDPTGRCAAKVDSYSKFKVVDSKLDLIAYESVITEFYSKYPKYQDIPYFYILSFLTDRQYKTADQLFKMATKGQLRSAF